MLAVRRLTGVKFWSYRWKKHASERFTLVSNPRQSWTEVRRRDINRSTIRTNNILKYVFEKSCFVGYWHDSVRMQSLRRIFKIFTITDKIQCATPSTFVTECVIYLQSSYSVSYQSQSGSETSYPQCTDITQTTCSLMFNTTTFPPETNFTIRVFAKKGPWSSTAAVLMANTVHIAPTIVRFLYFHQC